MTTIRSNAVKTMTPTVEIEIWHDPVVDAVGHDPRGDYVMEFWLPILGPSAMAVARKIMEHIDRGARGEHLVVAELAGAVGLSSRSHDGAPGRNSRIVSTLLRLDRFGLAHHAPRPGQPDLYRFRVTWPPLTRRQAERLPRHVLERLEAA